MKTITGQVDLGLKNRADGTPILILEAKDDEGIKYLKTLNYAIHWAWIMATAKGKADIKDISESLIKVGKKKGNLSLEIPLALGGVELFVPKEIKKAKHK
jgi:hypothetical protein